MKKSLSALLLLLLLFTGCEKNTIVQSGNSEQKPIEFDFKTTRDADCGMIVKSLKFAGQVIDKDGKTWFFHDPGGVPKFLENKDYKDEVVIWFYTMDTKRWKRAKDLFFSLTDTTPMGYGFAAYEKRKDGFIVYEEMRMKMLRGENLTNPYIRKKLLG